MPIIVLVTLAMRNGSSGARGAPVSRFATPCAPTYSPRPGIVTATATPGRFFAAISSAIAASIVATSAAGKRAGRWPARASASATDGQGRVSAWRWSPFRIDGASLPPPRRSGKRLAAALARRPRAKLPIERRRGGRYIAGHGPGPRHRAPNYRPGALIRQGRRDPRAFAPRLPERMPPMCADTPRRHARADTPDYKDTLFLPETDFPMRAGLPQREPDVAGPLGANRRLRPPARDSRGRARPSCSTTARPTPTATSTSATR